MIKKRITRKNIPRIYYLLTIFVLIMLAGLIGCATTSPYSPTAYEQATRIRILEEKAARQAEVIKAASGHMQSNPQENQMHRLLEEVTLAPPGHMQSNPQDNQVRRIRQLEDLVAKQQEVIEAMQSKLRKFKEDEGGKKP